MPTGVIINVLAVMLGGLSGSVFGNRLSSEFKEKLNLVFGICSMCIGISSVILMKNMPAVGLALILGTICGQVIHFGKIISRGGEKLVKLIPGQGVFTELLQKNGIKVIDVEDL